MLRFGIPFWTCNPAPIQVKFWEWTTLMGPYPQGKRWNSTSWALIYLKREWKMKQYEELPQEDTDSKPKLNLFSKIQLSTSQKIILWASEASPAWSCRIITARPWARCLVNPHPWSQIPDSCVPYGPTWAVSPPNFRRFPPKSFLGFTAKTAKFHWKWRFLTQKTVQFRKIFSARFARQGGSVCVCTFFVITLPAVPWWHRSRSQKTRFVIILTHPALAALLTMLVLPLYARPSITTLYLLPPLLSPLLPSTSNYPRRGEARLRTDRW